MKRRSSVAARLIGGLVVVIGGASIGLAGCGQKGPLVHPTAAQSPTLGAASAPIGTATTPPGN